MDQDQFESNSPSPNLSCVSKVLLIEDNPGDIALFKHYIGAGHAEKIDISTASSIAEAERLLANGSFDSIILDLRLPDANGVEAIQRIRRQVADVPIIVLSGILEPTMAPELVGEGVDSYHRKETVSTDALVWSLKLAIDRHRGLLNNSDTGVDDETGLFNQFGFQNVGAEAFKTACASDSDFCLIWLTLEQKNGTPVTESIKSIAKLIELSVRSSDLLARMEPASFLLALPNVGLKNGERIRDRLIRNLEVELKDKVGLKIGTAFLDPTKSTLSTLIVSARNDAKPVIFSN